MVCPGGELAFVRRMVAESAELRGGVHWYTTMVGKKATLKELRKELHALGVTALRTTELAQARAEGGLKRRGRRAGGGGVGRDAGRRPVNATAEGRACEVRVLNGP
jgi:hypothetical protein